jgi:glycosyltransferase involved in cell wall biosynthesis
VTSLTTEAYVQLLRDNEQIICALPFEHWARNRAFKGFIARLESERNALLIRGGRASRFFLVLPDESAEAGRLMWRIQSVPDRGVLVLGPESPPASSDGVLQAAVAPPFAIPEWLSDDDYLLPYAPGDFLHPALANTLALRMAADGDCPDVWAWNTTGYQLDDNGISRPTCFVRKPGRPNAAWLSGDVTGRAFAVRVKALRTLRLAEPMRAVLTHEAVACALAGGSWRHHPEYFGLYPAASEADLVPAVGRQADLARASTLLPEASWEAYPESPTPYCPAVWPKSAGQGISVIVPFRDKAQMTLETVQSVARQVTSTWIELVLVNNQSREEELALIHDGLPEIAGDRLKWKVVDYPHPFNHSRQCNVGARESAGETLVFLNNDATLDSADTLECFARWSGTSGVMTVAARIIDRNGQLQCAGLRARQNPGPDYNSPIEEGKDDLLVNGLKQVAGNSFACAAVRRDRYIAVGGLDEVLFPIGYNDIEFSLRSSGAGWKHLYLGWLCVSHSPGSSRGSSDEMLQKVLVRDRHSEVVKAAQYQLESDAAFLKLAIAKVEAAGQGAGGSALREWWNRCVRAVAATHQQR